jgi:hypothetical protein
MNGHSRHAVSERPRLLEIPAPRHCRSEIRKGVIPQRRHFCECRQQVAAVAVATLCGGCGGAGVGVLSTLRYTAEAVG